MDLNIKGIINLKFTDFDTVEDLMSYVREDGNFDDLRNIRFEDSKKTLRYESVFFNWSEIWVVNNYLVAKRLGGGEIIINPDFTRFLVEQPFNHTEKKKEEEDKLTEEFISELSVDSILDRISKIGFENITDVEKKFLKDNS
jgi:hypothetical protein